MKKLVFVFLLMVVVLPSLVTGQEAALITDRPDFTESASVVPRRSWQFEFGYTYSREGEVKNNTFGELLIRAGFHERIEVRFGLGSFVSESAAGTETTGREDMNFGVKIKLAEGSGEYGFGKPAVAVLASAFFPSGTDEFTADGVQPEMKLALAWDLNEKIAMGSNLNLSSLKGGDDYYTETGASLSFGISLSERAGCYAEYFGFFPLRDGYDNRSYLNGGFTFLLKPLFQFDIRAGTGLNGLDDDFFFGTGLSFIIK